MTTVDDSSTRGHTAKGLATRERILRQAADLLLRDGLNGFSLERVRKAASVSGSQIEHYFGDRGELVRTVLRRQIDIVLDFHRQPELGGLDAFDDWTRWSELNVGYLRDIGYRGTATYHALAGQLLKSDDDTRKIFAEGYARWVALLEDGFARMRGAGLLRDDAEPRHLALVVVCLHQGAGLLTFSYRQEWPLVTATRFVDDYVRGYATDPRDRRGRPRPATDRPPPRSVADRPTPTFTRKGLATRARIIAAAAELILRRGVNGTSVDDVRAAAGVSGSQMSHYFRDKDDLVRQVVAARADFAIEVHDDPRFEHIRSLASLREWAASCLARAGQTYVRHGCVYGSLAGELLDGGEGVLADLADGYDRWIAVFEKGLASMVRGGELRQETDPRDLAVACVVAHQGGALVSHATGSVDPLSAALSAVVSMVESQASQREPGVIIRTEL